MSEAVVRLRPGAGGELLDRLRRGEEEAVRRLYEAHAATVTRRLHRLCGDAEVARDLTQDTFVVALHRIVDFQAQGSLGTWLNGIAYNLLRDHRKSQRRRRGLFKRWFSGSAAPALPSARPDQPLDEQRLLEQLRAAMVDLDDDKRDAFVLRVVEGLSLEEASAVLDAKPSTVSYRARQAEEHVRKHFTEEKP